MPAQSFFFWIPGFLEMSAARIGFFDNRWRQMELSKDVVFARRTRVVFREAQGMRIRAMLAERVKDGVIYGTPMHTKHCGGGNQLVGVYWGVAGDGEARSTRALCAYEVGSLGKMCVVV